MDPVQRLRAMAERERRQRQPLPTRPSSHPPALSTEDAAWRHCRAQQALVEAVRAGRELDPAARDGRAGFARLGMTETDTLDSLLKTYPLAP